MKKLLYILAFCLAVTSTSIAQTDTTRVSISRTDRLPKASDFNTWEVAFNLGMTYPNTDLASSDFNGDNVKRNFGFGASVSKFFTHNFAGQFQIIHATIKGVQKQGKLGYTTVINYDFSFNAVMHIGNIGFLKHTPNFGLYAYAGVGLMNFDANNDSAGKDLGKNFLIENTTLRRIDYSGTTELVIPFGVGMRYRFAKKFSIHGEYSLRTTRSDKLDGYVRILSNYDDYSYFNIGVTYHIGKKDKTIEWVNPLQTIYSDLYDTKEKVDMLGGDKDKDGVADMFDKDNGTPDGVKVYGDGTAVDTDQDGVPDYLDADPFSAKGAKVDASGREIDNDGDGIPDSRDLEPNTPKGTLVDIKGNTIPIIVTSSGGTVLAGSSSSSIAAGYIPSVFFDLNSAVVTPKYYEQLADIALILKNNPSLKFDLIGNCDTRANESFNKSLGEKRAEAVKEHLMRRYTIESSRLNTASKGKQEPITNDHSMNRRVDFKVSQ